MGFVRRRARRRTMLVAGGAAYAAGRRANQGSDEPQQEEPVDEAQPQAPPATGEDAEIEQLASLAKLHDSGALTDEEFAAEKAKILGT